MADPFDFHRKPPPDKQGDLTEMEPRVTPVHRVTGGPATQTRDAKRTSLWMTWVIFAIIFMLLSLVDYRPKTDGDVYWLLASFFFFYAIDRIIG